MQVWLRLLIVWFVAIALPAQGMAGVTLAHCGPGHERMGSAAQAAQHPHADHDASAAPHHEADGVDEATPAPAAQAQAKDGKLTDPAQYTCSACASCCAGAALPSALPHMPQVVAASAVFTDLMVTVDAFAADGPDRPPRAFLV
jgi:hypothetical protein